MSAVLISRHPAHIDEGVGYLPMADGRWALVDPEDLPIVARYNWVVPRKGYPMALVTGRAMARLHRLIMPSVEGREIDHINRDKLDNRRSNLRYATKSENNANGARRVGGSGYRGVWPRTVGCWHVRVRGKYIGCFSTREEAARAYDQAALATFGEFATLNFPESRP